MNERGFFTIVGLCLLTVAAIFIKGIQEFETNYSIGITNFQAEHELQNFAESYLIEKFEELPPLNEGEIYKFPIVTVQSEKFKTVQIQIQAQNFNLKKFIRTYSTNTKYTDDDAGEPPQNAIILVSIASCDSPFITGKIFRRSFAYVLTDDPETTEIDESATIHFLNSL